jgi:hypothetical protein
MSSVEYEYQRLQGRNPQRAGYEEIPCDNPTCERTMLLKHNDVQRMDFYYCNWCVVYESETARRLGYQHGRYGSRERAEIEVSRMAHQAARIAFWRGVEDGRQATRLSSRSRNRPRSG